MQRLAYLCISTALVAAAADRPHSEPKTVRVDSGLLRLIDQVDVPSQAKGILARIAAEPGELVREDDLLVQLDDSDSVLAVERARLELEIAAQQAENQALVEEARTAVAEAEAAR